MSAPFWYFFVLSLDVGIARGCVHLFLALPGYHKWGQWEEFPPFEFDMSILAETASEAQRKRQQPQSRSSAWKTSLLNLPPSYLLCSHPELAGWGSHSTKRAGNSDISESGPPGRRRVAWRWRPAELWRHLQSCGGTLRVRPQGSVGFCRKACPLCHWEGSQGTVITGRQTGWCRKVVEIMTLTLVWHGSPYATVSRGYGWRQL